MFKVTSQTLSALSTLGPANRPHSWPLSYFVHRFVAAGAVFRSIRGQCVLEDGAALVTNFQRDKLDRSIEIDTGEVWHYDIVLPAAPRRRFANSVRVCHAWDVCVFRMYLPYGLRRPVDRWHVRPARRARPSAPVRSTGPNMGNHDKRAMTSNVKGPCGNAHKAARRTRV